MNDYLKKIEKEINSFQSYGDETVTLANCDKEPIHLIGHIQNHLQVIRRPRIGRDAQRPGRLGLQLACKQRFAKHPRADRLRYHTNVGSSLSVVADASITFVYCWDAMVHFDRRVIRAYLKEIERILVPGGRGALHYSNYGAQQNGEETNWRDNPHWRSSMTRELFNGYCDELGLNVVADRLLEWDGIPEMDCASVFEKPRG